MNVLYTGTFDPLTKGHLDIIKRAANIADKVYILVNTNSSKNALYLPHQRYNMVVDSTKNIQNVEVLCPTNNEMSTMTTTDFIQKYNVDALIRGIRNSRDAEYEHELYMQYKRLFPKIEELVMFADKEMVDFSSTFVRECIKYGKWDAVKKAVPPEVYKIIKLNPGYK